MAKKMNDMSSGVNTPTPTITKDIPSLPNKSGSATASGMGGKMLKGCGIMQAGVDAAVKAIQGGKP